MSDYWFEEAMRDLNDESDSEEKPIHPADAEPSADEPDGEKKPIHPADAEPSADEPDTADRSSNRSPTASTETTQPASGEPSGTDSSAEDDPFGFGTDDAVAESDPEQTDTEAGPDSETGNDTQSADALEQTKGPYTAVDSSTAQSPEEFGFSLDSDDTATDTTAPSETVETSSEPADTAETAAATAETAPTAEADTEPSDDPFGFGESGDSSGGGGPQMEQSGDDDFGFGGFGGGGGGGASSPSGSEEFDDDEFDSDIDRIDLGIEGLDNMILGGVPERSLIGIIGGAGTGKTTFGLQFLNEALKNGERAVFITLEQTEEAVLSTAEEKGWPFRKYADSNQLAIVVLDPVEMANSLASIRGDISRLIREFGASRLVLDSVSLLEMMYDHPARRRSEVFDFTRSLKDAGVTTLLTSEASEESSHASRYGAVEYLTDAVFILRYVRTSNFEETRLALEIQKIRDANHSRATKPYDLTDEGMSVHRQANIF